MRRIRGSTGTRGASLSAAREHDLRRFSNVTLEVRNERDGRFPYYYSHTFVPGDTLTLPAFEYFDEMLRSCLRGREGLPKRRYFSRCRKNSFTR